jgi:hypothetical protein
MSDEEIYDEAGEVSASDGIVFVDGPDSVDIKLTADAAEQMSDRLMTGALKARGQSYFEDKKRPR